jgi:hypothetical protein
LAAVSGLAVSDLQARCLGFLDSGSIFVPLGDLLRPLEEEEAAAMATVGPNTTGNSLPIGEQPSAGAVRTEYVADKMADLVAEIDGCEESGPDQVSPIEEIQTEEPEMTKEEEETTGKQLETTGKQLEMREEQAVEQLVKDDDVDSSTAAAHK